MDMNLSKLQETVQKRRLVCYHPWGHRQTQASDWTTTKIWIHEITTHWLHWPLSPTLAGATMPSLLNSWWWSEISLERAPFCWLHLQLLQQLQNNIIKIPLSPPLNKLIKERFQDILGRYKEQRWSGVLSTFISVRRGYEDKIYFHNQKY